MSIEAEIYDVLFSTRLQVIGDKQVESLSDIQKQELLLVRFSTSQSEDESVVSLNFTSYRTGKPLTSCRGTYGLGWSKENDMSVATKKTFEQMKKLFQIQYRNQTLNQSGVKHLNVFNRLINIDEQEE